MNEEKELYLEEYYQLCRKLNKFPNKREIVRYIPQPYRYEGIWGGVTDLKKDAIAKYPELEEMALPAELVYVDLEEYKLDLDEKLLKKKNQKLIQEVTLFNYVEKFAEKIFNGQVKVNAYKSKTSSVNRILNLVLSDLHFGSDIDGEETGSLFFGATEEARRFAKVILETALYKKDHREDTILHVFLLGDVIQGMLGHDPRDGAELAEQYCRAVHILKQGLQILVQEFKQVKVFCATGNHDRNTGRHHGRAIHSKYDSYSTMIYYSLMKMFSAVKTIEFIIPKTPFVIAQNFDKKIFAWHGDTGISVGNVGKSLNISNIEKQMNKLNSSVKDSDEYAAFVCGHLHHGTVSFLPNGATLIVNGGLPPTDSFGISLGSHESNSGQMLFESIPGLAVGDIRYIRVNQDVDNDKELDKLIKAWQNYNN